MSLQLQFISPVELVARHPLIDSRYNHAALWDEKDGDLDPFGATYAFAKSARVLGAEGFTQTPISGASQRPDGSWDVSTPKGEINAEKIVDCGGLWARELGHMGGLHLLVQPMEHHYLIADDIREIAERMVLGGKRRLPAGIDYEANIYVRQESGGMLLCTYVPHSTPQKINGAPLDFGHELLNADLDRFADRLEMSFERIPAIGETGIKNIINGPFTFGPGGNPMTGPALGLYNYWVAVGVMAGFCQGGGVGLTMAEQMIYGKSSIEGWAMDVARFGEFATPGWVAVKSSENCKRRFVMSLPNKTLPKGHLQKTTALHGRLLAQGALMSIRLKKWWGA